MFFMLKYKIANPLGGIKMIYVTGDMHGDITRFKSCFNKIKKVILIICGDLVSFGRNQKNKLEEIGQIKVYRCFY